MTHQSKEIRLVTIACSSECERERERERESEGEGWNVTQIVGYVQRSVNMDRFLNLLKRAVSQKYHINNAIFFSLFLCSSPLYQGVVFFSRENWLMIQALLQE